MQPERPPERPMKNNEILIAQAKKAARRASRSQGKPYQSCLDDLARTAGRRHWSAFLSDPVDITPSAEPATASPVTTPTISLPDAAPDVGSRTAADHPVRTSRRSGPTIGDRILQRLGLSAGNDLIRQAVARRIVAKEGPKSGYEGHPLLGTAIGGGRIGMAELVPVLAVAPPGTGKSAGIVIPAILTSDAISLVIHDEYDLHVMTSGRRSELGPVTVLHLGAAPSNGSLNPLSRSWLPRDPASRSSYVNRIAEALSPEDRLASAILSRSITEAIADGDGTTFAAVDRILGAGPADPLIHAARTALGPMLDPGVSECTSRDVFRPSDLRRGRSDDGRPEVGTLYLVRGREDGHRQARAAATIQAAIWYHCLSHAPGERDFDGERVGPRGILTIMDGANHLPVMPMLATALDTGRSKKVGHMILGPSHGSIRRIFDQTMRDEFASLIGLEIVLAQNSMPDAERIARRYPDLSIGEIMSPAQGHHLLLVQNLSGPIRMRTPFFFESPELLAHSYNPRTGKGPKPVTGTAP